MDKIIEIIKKFNDDRDWGQFHSLDNLAKSISIEAAELLECFQWDNDYDLNDVEDELADVLNYCFQLAIELDLDIEKIMLNKIEKNAEKYPIKKAKGVSTKYDKL